MDYKDVRVWQLNFEVHRPIPNLPIPDIVVEEVQKYPTYRLDGKKRKGVTDSQISVTLGGEGGLRVGDTIHRLTPGMAFLHNHDDENIEYFYPMRGQEDWRFIWIAFGSAEDIVEQFNKRYGYLFRLPLNRGLVAKLRAYQTKHQSVEILSPFGGASLVYDLFTELAESDEKKQMEHPRSMLVASAQELIIRKINTCYTVEDLADKLQVSREHLSRSFREQTGQTIHRYILDSKLELALTMLTNQHLSCKEIAEMTGFEHYSSFSRAVKRKTGYSPEALRNKK